MARISSYPKDSTIQDKDAWIGTESTNRATRNFTAEDIANYVVTSTSGVTGSGTLNTIPMWTPDGSKLGDSIMTQVLLTPSTYALDVGSSRITETSVASTTISGTTVIATNITGINAGIVSLNGDVGIGNEATDILQITSSVSDSTGTGSTAAGQVLLSNAAGQLVWGSSGSGNVTGSGTTNTLPIWSDGPNGALGDSIMTQFSGRIGIGGNPQRELDVFGGIRVRGPLDLFQQNDNTLAGQDAGNWYNITGSKNTAFGKNSQSVAVGASQNTSVGYDSMAAGIVGNLNVAVGDSAMATSNGGSFNTAVGAAALQDQEAGQGNTAIGYNSLNNKDESNFNTAVGCTSLFNVSTGFKNIGIGDNVGSTLTGGSRNVLIGSNANVAADTNNNSIVIGESAVGSGSNTVTLGNNNITDTYLKGNVIFPATITADGSIGAAGQVLSSTATGVEWTDPSSSITKLVPYFQVATPGGSDTYTESNNIVDFDWSGGSGTYEYILPSATDIPYRTIRFVNNSTITASDKIHITAPGTETIDGGAFYEINKAYNGCAVWSDGVQWIVIQAKA